MREEYFLNYNEDNIMSNLLQAEDHLRNIEGGAPAEHGSCIMKHLLLVKGEADEGISHSSVAMPEKTQIFKIVKASTENLKNKIETDGFSPQEDMVKIRDIRKVAEGLRSSFNLSECKACGMIGEAVGEIKHNVVKRLEDDAVLIGLVLFNVAIFSLLAVKRP